MTTATRPPQAAPTTPLEKALRRIGEVSSLPHVALKVMEIVNDPNAGAADLKRVLETDASLSARVLRSVNSSAYGLRVKITNLQQAIAYLGMKQIRNLAVTASVAELFKANQEIGPYRRTELWRHLVAVGICSRLVAMRLKLLNFDDMFLAGLLHDLGIILEDQYLNHSFSDVVHALQPGMCLPQVEQAYLGFDHTALGEGIARRWNFPESIIASIAHHHNSSAYQGPQPEVVRCVEVGNLLCTYKNITSVGVKLVTGSRAVLDTLSLSKDDLVVMASDLEHELALQADLFKI